MKFIYVLFLCFSTMISAYTNVSPVYFDERIDGEGGYKEYTLTNSTNKVLKYRIYSEKISDSMDMSEWIDLYPMSLTLKSGESKKVKMLVSAPKEAKEGEYIAVLGIKELEVPNEKESKNISLLTNLKIEIAGYIGDLKPSIKIDKILLKNKENLELKITNTSKRRYRFDGYLEKIDGTREFFKSFRLFAGETKNFDDLKIKNLKNNEKLKFIILDGEGNKLIEKELK